MSLPSPNSTLRPSGKPMKRVSAKKLAEHGGRIFSTFTGPRQAMARVGRRAKRQGSSREACRRIVRQRANGLCEAGPVFHDPACAIAGEHVHEVRSRAQGGSITDPANCLFVCWHCHRRIHANPKRSAELGLLHSKKYSEAA